jgi:hypothetical protein
VRYTVKVRTKPDFIVYDGERMLAWCQSQEDADRVRQALAKTECLRVITGPLTQRQMYDLRDERGRVKVVFAATLNEVLADHGCDGYGGLFNLVRIRVYRGQLRNLEFVVLGVASDGSLIIEMAADVPQEDA